MRFCQAHWDRLREAINARGLSALVADSGEKAASNFADEVKRGPTDDNYDPLMSAVWAIVNNLSDVGGGSMLLLDGCPLCYANEAHAKGCTDPACGSQTYFDGWIERAADDQVQVWKQLAGRGSRRGNTMSATPKRPCPDGAVLKIRGETFACDQTRTGLDYDLLITWRRLDGSTVRLPATVCYSGVATDVTDDAEQRLDAIKFALNANAEDFPDKIDAEAVPVSIKFVEADR